jgi:hypothetical protein
MLAWFAAVLSAAMPWSLDTSAPAYSSSLIFFTPPSQAAITMGVH